jgi:sugar O-acyltransferase (sialic acid O-acetyltransferase NeuD family)
MKQNLIIIGAGGSGRTIYQIATECTGYRNDFDIKGFLDDDPSALDNFEGYPPVLSPISEYEILQNDIFICSIGNVKTKAAVIRSVLDRGGKFKTLIHPFAQISKNCIIGEGSLIARNAIIGPDSYLSNHVLIQAGSVIGHDSRIGEFCRVDCNVVCVGGTVLEDEVTLHTSAIINHNVTIGKYSIVGAGSFVIRNVPASTTVYGNPAKRLI